MSDTKTSTKAPVLSASSRSSVKSGKSRKKRAQSPSSRGDKSGTADDSSDPEGRRVERTQSRTCDVKGCTKQRHFSEFHSKFIKMCTEHAQKKREDNRRYYHNKGKADKEKTAVEEKLAERNELVWGVRRRNKDLCTRLATLQTQYDALSESFNVTSKQLSNAMARLNGDNTAAEIEGTAVSVRNESIVIQRLQELTQLLTTSIASKEADFQELFDRAAHERNENKETSDFILGQFESAMKKVVE